MPPLLADGPSSHILIFSLDSAGNKRFRATVTASLEAFMRADTRFEKSQVIQSIVQTIQHSGGRFLKRDAKGHWFELTNQQAKEKVGHAVRDAVNSIEGGKFKKQGAKKKAPPGKKAPVPKAARKPPPDSKLPASSGYGGAAQRVPSSQIPPAAFAAPRHPPASSQGSVSHIAERISAAVAAGGRTGSPHGSAGSSLQGHGEQEGEERGHDDHFLARIDDVLGPLDVDADAKEDPIQRFLKKS